MTPPFVTVVGGGLAGCEAAWQLAEAGVTVRLFEMKPGRYSPAHEHEGLAELVCSNSFRGADVTNAVGLLKAELELAGALFMRAARASAVPAGGALAVDRERFSENVTAAVSGHPLVSVERGEVERIPDVGPVIIATGPLTSDALAADILARTGRNALAFYDAIAPIVAGDSIDRETVFAASRYEKGDGDDYLNCPFSEEQYHAFIDALLAAEKTALRDFEDPRFFQGCLPIEEMAAQGRLAPAFGPMKPVGLFDPRTGRRPFAVVQLRHEDVPGTAYNLVGFQTRLKQPDQKRVFQMIPGLEQARFSRFGGVHRNTFLDGPRLLDDSLRLRTDPRIRFAGQVTGVEGYVESAATGWIAGRALAAEVLGRPGSPLPESSSFRALLRHVTHGGGSERYEPSNIRWDLFPPLEKRLRRRRERREALAERALTDLRGWLAANGSASPRASSAARDA